jgi:hypothetical protein
MSLEIARWLLDSILQEEKHMPYKAAANLL